MWFPVSVSHIMSWLAVISDVRCCKMSLINMLRDSELEIKHGDPKVNPTIKLSCHTPHSMKFRVRWTSERILKWKIYPAFSRPQIITVIILKGTEHKCFSPSVTWNISYRLKGLLEGFEHKYLWEHLAWRDSFLFVIESWLLHWIPSHLCHKP